MEELYPGLENILHKNRIVWIHMKNVDTYQVRDKESAFFSITFNKKLNKYVVIPKELSIPNVPNSELFDAISYAYKIQELSKIGKKDIAGLYTQSMVDSDVLLEKRGNFETYVTMYKGVYGYAIGYNPLTKQYGFKRYSFLNLVHKIGDIPFDKKPDYAKLYKQTKDLYIAYNAMDNIKHLYE